jgi:hypothetical protein
VATHHESDNVQIVTKGETARNCQNLQVGETLDGTISSGLMPGRLKSEGSAARNLSICDRSRGAESFKWLEKDCQLDQNAKSAATLAALCKFVARVRQVTALSANTRRLI